MELYGVTMVTTAGDQIGLQSLTGGEEIWPELYNADAAGRRLYDQHFEEGFYRRGAKGTVVMMTKKPITLVRSVVVDFGSSGESEALKRPTD